ncbi:MAG: bifunctional deaminase-reductase domain protein [Gaiellaceae bacterium]|nr:bifunctional deaminase-reductase domain protein [Gaiellaceae bacterium]
MSRLIVLTAMTVDGVMTVEEWFVPEGDHMEASLRLFEGDTALLYGRKNYEGLAAYWMAAEGEWADLLNPMPKFVASRTLQEPLTWNATLLKGELEDAVAKLKAERDGDLITNGWAVWGKGERPFWEEEKLRLTLLGTETYDSGVVLLRYEPQRA